MPPPRLYVWPPLSPGAYRKSRAGALPFPLGEPRARLFSRARQGLFQGLRTLGLGRGDSILVPAYNNGSEVEAIRRAGVECRFYDIAEDLQPNEAQLEKLLRPDVRALYIIHYFGWPQDAHRWRAWCDQRGLLLVEDAAMAWLSSIGGRPVGSFGDLAIFCLYKSVGLPDGGCVISSTPPEAPDSAGDFGLGMLAIRHFSWLAQRAWPAAAVHGALSRYSPKLSRLSFTPGREFDLGDPDSPPCRATVALIPKLADVHIASQRRENYSYLVSALQSVVHPVHTNVPEGASPVGLPIWVPIERQQELARHLERYGVFATRLWPDCHPSVPAKGDTRSEFVRKNSFVLPVHQELRAVDLDRIVVAVREAWRKSSLPAGSFRDLSDFGSRDL
jgi:dTDP-4-amino-4,6-dideoxygalactose transaminase